MLCSIMNVCHPVNINQTPIIIFFELQHTICFNLFWSSIMSVHMSVCADMSNFSWRCADMSNFSEFLEKDSARLSKIIAEEDSVTESETERDWDWTWLRARLNVTQRKQDCRLTESTTAWLRMRLPAWAYLHMIWVCICDMSELLQVLRCS